MQHIMKYISKLLVLFAIITMATACKDDINEVNNPLSVTTPAVSAIKGTSAAVTSMATGSHITYRGICFSQSSNPTVDDYKVMAFQQKMSVTITGLQPNTTYYVRAYAHDGEGYVYSNEITLPITAPVVVTTTVTKQSNTKATLSGDITTLGDVSCVAGICLSTSANPTTADTYQSITVTSTGEYSIDFTGLTAGTTYHYRAFAHNTSGDAYGADATYHHRRGIQHV